MIWRSLPTQRYNELRRSYADVVNHLPDGLETLVGDDGVLLPGERASNITIGHCEKRLPVLIMNGFISVG